MRKIIISLIVCSTFLLSSVARAEIDPKLKMMATMAGYGVVGGALLGTASLAFDDSKPRNIAKGASLGLYAGILLGGYIILSYEMKKRGFGVGGDNYYPDSSGYYDDDQASVSGGAEYYNLAQFENKKDPKKVPLFYMNMVNLTF